ncbi:MAG: hypothetical protein AAF752_10205, partial [Bacteroidota bacterium]
MVHFHRLQFLAVAVLLFALAPSTLAQTPARSITLDEAIQIGLAQDVQLQKDLNALRLQERVVQAERGDFLPNLNASVGPS